MTQELAVLARDAARALDAFAVALAREAGPHGAPTPAPPRAPAPYAPPPHAPPTQRGGGGLYGGPPRPGEGPCAPNFGKCAGQPLATLDDRDLAFYRTAIERSLADPAKARYAASNSRMLHDIVAEQGARGGR